MQSLALLPLSGVHEIGSAAPSDTGKKRKIGFLIPAQGNDQAWQQLLLHLNKLGWFDGHNIEILTKRAHGQSQKIPGLFAELVGAGVEVVVTTGASSARAALTVETDVPIVGAGLVDPVVGGLVTSLAHPNVNLTGVSILFDDISLKLLELLVRIDPSVTSIATLCSPISTTSPRVPNKLKEVASSMGIDNQIIYCSEESHIPRVFDEIGQLQPQALLVVQAPFFIAASKQIAALAIEHKIIALGQAEVYAEAGFLASYGVNYPRIFGQAATYVDRILKGTSVSLLPIEQASDLQIVLNMSTFKSLNYQLSGELSMMADKIIDG